MPPTGHLPVAANHLMLRRAVRNMSLASHRVGIGRPVGRCSCLDYGIRTNVLVAEDGYLPREPFFASGVPPQKLIRPGTPANCAGRA